MPAIGHPELWSEYYPCYRLDTCHWGLASLARSCAVLFICCGECSTGLVLLECRLSGGLVPLEWRIIAAGELLLETDMSTRRRWRVEGYCHLRHRDGFFHEACNTKQYQVIG